MTITAWAITTGAAGMRAQARGLAERCADRVIDRTIDLKPPWRWLPAHLAPFALSGLAAGSDDISPPWPDLVVSCGRRSAIVCAAIRRASRGAVLAVHVQDPLADPAAFDLVIALPRDSVRGRNVVQVPAALNAVTPERLSEAAEVWRGRFSALGRPLVGVVLGGSTRERRFDPAAADRLVEGLSRLRAGAGAGLAITPSRRTPVEVLQRVEFAFANDPRVFVWNRVGENPYLAILALADRLVVTSDSLSMISEALATSAPLEVFDLGLTGGRHAGFLQDLVEAGLARRFAGEAAPPQAHAPVDPTGVAAAAVQALLQARGLTRDQS